ncbi:glycerol-3-phosphate acyltransferase [Halalkalibacter akibai]|uniref:Glycerol-3-phosphate acyltransferase n=1 Tax=Halalkalibacter akibai (strain ATCC 43226 / DSM 21942 / CIP 109018 / JCM 9157 / 1139) TaxID=1236973 RepID=W4QYF3_HALA3|nr:glycerol-3-phosphate acyltransferase [Halalkalibacter akibai]GAE37116.1 acyl-phosphate:glycerol-3-phosphate O-acyltransferase PlsY [Halalkalibacter akibai JCM 9157]
MYLFLMFCLLAYLTGSIPTGKIVARLKGVDIQKVGTKNIGSSNVYLNLGKKMALLVLIGDMGKAFLIVTFAAEYFSLGQTMFIGLCLIIGNLKSLFLNFSGGKGVATSLGIFLATEPIALLFLGILWILGLLFKKYILWSGIGAIFLIPYQYSGYGEGIAVISAFFIILFMLLKHNENIKWARVEQEAS